MMNHDPGKRPGAEMALQKWRKIKAGLSTSTVRWRLRKPDESVGERVVLDTIAVAKQGIRSITHLFNDDVRAILYPIDTWLNFSIVVADLVAGFDATHMLAGDLERLEHPFMGLASLPVHLSLSCHQTGIASTLSIAFDNNNSTSENNEPDLDGYPKLSARPPCFQKIVFNASRYKNQWRLEQVNDSY
jgi:hypothetical protein